MTKHEYRQAFRLTDREKAEIWNEIRNPDDRRSRPRAWLPASGGLVAVACLLAIIVLLSGKEPGRGPAPAPEVAAVLPSGEQAAASPAPARPDASTRSATRQPEAAAAAAPGKSAATATLRGRVFDGGSHEPLAFANVAVLGTGRSTLTDSLGYFSVRNIAPGTHEIAVNALGFEAHTEVLTASPGDTTLAIITLPVDVLEMLVAFNVDAARYMVQTKASTTIRENVADGTRRLASIGAKRSAPAPTVGAESGGQRNPNDRPYDLVYHQHHGVNPFVTTAEDALSTFALEVDDASWTVARRYLTDGNLPPPEAVRLEEIVNRFEAGLVGSGDDDFSLHADGMPSRFGSGYHLLRLGVRARDVAPAARVPALLIFVIDVSGSMAREDRLELVKKALRVLVDELQEGDRVGIVTFGSSARVDLEPVGIEQRERILASIDAVRPNGSTNIDHGLNLAYELARQHARTGTISRLILCGDGVANQGHTGAESILASARREADRGVSLTTVGFGMGNYNDTLMEQLANRGDGTYHYVDRLADAERVFRQNLTGTLQYVGREVKAQVEFDPAAVVRWRLLGYENRHLEDEDFRDDTVDAGEIGAGHTAVALYEVKLSDEASAAFASGQAHDLGAMRVRWAKPHFHPQAGAVTERERRLSTADLAAGWVGAPARLRAAAVAAEFAEILRESYWARGSKLADLLEPAGELVRDLPDDPDILELAQMIRRAVDLQAAREPARD